jgi:UDP-N-acetylmuramate dehydrogenase
VDVLHALRAACASPIRQHVALAPLTTWHVGGPARFLVEPRPEELGPLLNVCREHRIAARVVGRGSNLLVADGGYDGMVLLTRRSLAQLRLESDRIVAGAGVALPSLARCAAQAGFGGFEGLGAIPGTVGGGLVMNAGTNQFPPHGLGALVASVSVVDETGAAHCISESSALGFGLRSSAIAAQGLTVAEAVFMAQERIDPALARDRLRAVLAARRTKFPLSARTAGSTFVNPPGSRSAGWYVEQCGLKGVAVGGARVSPLHANWILNEGGATAADITALIQLVRDRVHARMGVLLRPEVHELGQSLLHGREAPASATLDPAPQPGT